MSDVPQGPGWWRGADGKWYPPMQPAAATWPAPVPQPQPVAQVPPAPGWWQAADGGWHPPGPAFSQTPGQAAPVFQGGPPHTPVQPPKKRWRWLVVIGLALAIGVGVTVILGVVADNQVHRLDDSGGGSGGIPGSSGLTLSQLTSQVQSQITASSSNHGFAVQGVSSVVCNPPSNWQPGATFKCFAYDSNGDGLGEYDGTVEPSASDGSLRWNADWIPSG